MMKEARQGLSMKRAHCSQRHAGPLQASMAPSVSLHGALCKMETKEGQFEIQHGKCFQTWMRLSQSPIILGEILRPDHGASF
jgi:hypothetical protein